MLEEAFSSRPTAALLYEDVPYGPVLVGADGIRANCVAPGPVYTPMVYAGGMSEQARDTRRHASLLKREGLAGTSAAPCASCFPTRPVTSLAMCWSLTVELRS